MLEWMQRHKKYLVITVWVSAFALIFGWYLPELFSGKSPSNNVAKVGSDYINRQEFDRVYNQIYERLKQFYPDFDSLAGMDSNKLPEVENLAFEKLTSDMLLSNMARDVNLSVSNAELLDFLMHGPYRQYFVNANNQFDKEVYKSVLANNKISPESFESSLKQEILVEKMRNLPTFPVSTLEMNAFLSAFGVKDNIAIKVVSEDSILKDSTQMSLQKSLKEDEVKKYWEAHKAKYIRPARYKLAYVAVDSDDIESSDSDIEKYYKENVSQYAGGLDENRESVINDYKKEYMKLVSLYVSGVAREAKDSKIVKENKEAKNSPITQNPNENLDKQIITLNKDSIKTIKNALDSDSDIKMDSIPLHFIEVSDDDYVKYQNLLLQLANTQKGKLLSPVLEGDGKTWIMSYLLEKTQRQELGFEEAKQKARQDLITQKREDEFKKKSRDMLARLKSNDFTKIGFISAKDSNNAIKYLESMELTKAEIPNIIRQIMTSQNKKDIIFSGKKAIFFDILEQKLPEYSELINLATAEGDKIKQLKDADMQETLYEYAKGKYKIIDYRRQN